MKKLTGIFLLCAAAVQISASEPADSGLLTRSIGFTPDLLLSLAFASGTNEGQTSPPISGTLYLGGAKNHEEVILGVGGSVYNFELLWQYRRYWSEDCRGVFAGLYGSASWMRGSMEFLPDGGTRFPSETGTTFHSAGLRFGGNVGFRLDLWGVGLSPRVGLVIPALVNFGYGDLSGEQVSNLYRTNALFRSIDLALVIELLSQAPDLSP